MAYPCSLLALNTPLVPGTGTTILPNPQGGLTFPVGAYDELLVLLTYTNNTGSVNAFVDVIDTSGNAYQLAAGTASTTATGQFVFNIGKGQTINTSFGQTIRVRITATVAGASFTGQIIGK